MSFWVRRFLLFLALVVGPVGTALWLDAETEVARAREAGARDAGRAASSLDARVSLRVQRQVDQAVTVAHALEDAQVLTLLASDRRRDAEAKAQALAEAAERLEASRPEGGFAWLVDGAGRVVAGLSGADPEAPPRSIRHHPLFVQTQLGVAGDLLWRQGAPLVWAAGAPLVIDGRAQGAVLVGWPLDAAFVSGLSAQLDLDLTLTRDGEVLHASLDPEVAAEIAGLALESTGPVTAGRLAEPLPSPLPGLPLFIGPRADGLAYTSVAADVPGEKLHWIVSVPASSALEALALRQLNLLAGGAALALILLLFAVIDHRTYVKPIGLIAEHMSEIQLGRGEIELSELRVSKPFRRVVRLINMTVQKLPARGLATLTGSAAAVSAAPRPPPAQGATPSGSQLRLDAVLSDEGSAPAAPPKLGEEDAFVADALASLGQAPAVAADRPGSGGRAEEQPAPPAAAAPATAQASPPEDAEDDISKAIASLGGSARRSASHIRGNTPAPEVSDDPFHEVSQFTLRPKVRGQSQVAPAGGVRGGGSLDLGQGAGLSDEGSSKPEGADSTVVAPVAKDLLAQTAREDLTGHAHESAHKQDMTVVATVDPKLLSQTLGESSNGLDEADRQHFAAVYDEFLALRKRCGEQTQDLVFERFRTKLEKNRAKLIDKYNCKTVRFQVYEKDGKAALKATPVRKR